MINLLFALRTGAEPGGVAKGAHGHHREIFGHPTAHPPSTVKSLLGM